MEKTIQETIDQTFGEKFQEDQLQQKRQLAEFLKQDIKEVAPNFTIDDEEKIVEETKEPVTELVSIDIVKRQDVNLVDFVLQKSRKLVKRPSLFQSVSIIQLIIR